MCAAIVSATIVVMTSSPPLLVRLGRRLFRLAVAIERHASQIAHNSAPGL
jgi:hypothetical protein